MPTVGSRASQRLALKQRHGPLNLGVLGASNILTPSQTPPSPLSPTAPSTFSVTSSRSSSVATPTNDADDLEEHSELEAPFSLGTHPAVVFVSDRLSDTTYTSRLRTVNVFDFDQTLFQSPLPNPALWDPSFLGTLTSWNYCGTGWWHNPGTLELGPEIEASCWEGWWNEEVVEKVRESSEDPGSLTVLLTGRNGPVFGQKLIEMVTRKGLDFDLIATKPTTVARIEDDAQHQQSLKPTKKASEALEKYIKVHTFSTKHEFLYNLLLEYPQIRSMHLWDDRPCQVAKFRQIGQEWLDNKMLDTFEITVVKEALLYLDQQREVSLVLAMVEANNHQVDIEKAGGPFLVAGVGALPRTRPELRDLNIWDPYETYVPQERLKIEVDLITQYTGVIFQEAVQKVIRDKIGSQTQSEWIDRPLSLRGKDLSGWTKSDDLHVTLCSRTAPAEFLESIGGLGATVLVEVEALGHYEGRLWAIKVKEMNLQDADHDQRPLHIVAPNGVIYSSLDALKSAYASHGPSPSTGSRPDSLSIPDATRTLYDHVDMNCLGHLVLAKDLVPHILMAYDRINGARAGDSKLIHEWEPLATSQGTPFPGRLVLVGTIGQRQLLGMKPSLSSSQRSVKAEVSLGHIIKNLLSNKDIPGKELGKLVKAVKEEMERLSVENRVANEERIATIAQEICDRVESMRMSAPTSAAGSPSSPTTSLSPSK
ncbi:MAG: hypothetical protein J3Q66DRAFT_393164 [Benniella sp.]|nr:MAG: hypothetical protein J3Q66DRAFT_393164 [Benniella sp.]